MPITNHHAAAVESVPRHHHYPFDRLLVAEAVVEGVALVSSDKIMKRYDVEVIW